LQNHPPVPVHQYPGIPRHHIEHLHVQHMRRLRSPSPPSIQLQPSRPFSALLPTPQLLPAISSPLPAPLPVPAPQLLPPVPAPLPVPVDNSLPHLPQPQRVDYSARLMENFNSDHQRRRSRRSNRVSTSLTANAHAGPMHPPVIPHQNVINFQHEADQQAQAERFRHILLLESHFNNCNKWIRRLLIG